MLPLVTEFSIILPEFPLILPEFSRSFRILGVCDTPPHTPPPPVAMPLPICLLYVTRPSRTVNAVHFLLYWEEQGQG